MGKVYDSFCKSFHGLIFLPVSSNWLFRIHFLLSLWNKSEKSYQQAMVILFIWEVLGCSDLEFLKESLDVVRETLCTCDQSTSVLKRGRGLSALRD